MRKWQKNLGGGTRRKLKRAVSSLLILVMFLGLLPTDGLGVLFARAEGTGESAVANGTYSFMNNDEGTHTGIAFTNFSLHDSHGMHAGSDSAVSIILDSKKDITVKTCCYGNGKDTALSVVSGTAETPISETWDEGSGNLGHIWTIPSAETGTIVFSMGSDFYIHEIVIADAANDSGSGSSGGDSTAVANGTYTFNSADVAPAGIGFDGFSFHDTTHGLQGGNGAKVILTLDADKDITVVACCYGTGAPMTVTNGTAGIPTSEATSEIDGDKVGAVWTIAGAKQGTVELTVGSTCYIHSITIADAADDGTGTPGSTTPPSPPVGEDYFTVWFNTDGSTSVAAGEYAGYPIYFGESMAAQTNKITVGGTEYYSVQGTSNPKKGGSNPNGAIPDSGAYLKVTPTADGQLTVYGYEASGKPFYATNGPATPISDGNAFCNGTHSYTVDVHAGEAWYFYAQGSKAQFVGVKLAPPATRRDVPVAITGVGLGTSHIKFVNTEKSADEQIFSDGNTTVSLEVGATYNVSIDNGSVTIDIESVSVTESTPDGITITISAAPTHVVSGEFKGLPGGASVTSLTFKDEANATTVATVNGNSYTVDLKNGKYTAEAVTGAEGYTVYDHVAVTGTQGEAISNDVWFYGPTTAYPTGYRASLKVGTASGCDYSTITEAIAAVKAMTRENGERVVLELCDSIYTEQVIVDTPNVTFKAADGVNPTIRWYYGIGYKYYSIDSTGFYNIKNANDKYDMHYADRWGAVVRVKSPGFIAEGVKFSNTFNQEVIAEEIGDSMVGTAAEYGQSISGSLQERVMGLDVANGTNVERAAAVAIDADMAEFYKCEFVSSQDTLYTGSAKSYFNECKIVGQTDYIFGNGGAAIFDNCDLQWLGYTSGGKAGYITAARGKYVFRGCEITDGTHTVTPGYFGRPWNSNADVTFLLTDVAGSMDPAGWSAMSGVTPEQVVFREYGNTKNGENFYSSYASAEATKDTFQLSKADAEKLANPAYDGDYLGSWTPVHHITTSYDLSGVEGWAEVDSNEDGNTDDSAEIKTYVLEAKDLTAFGENTKTDGETQQIGTNNYFTAIWSTKSKIDSSSKTFEDGYESGQRINFGASSTKEKNSLKFTTKHPAKVKVWWVAGGNDRPMAIFNSTGNVATSTGTVAKDGLYTSVFNLATAGEYYLGGTAGNDYIFKVEVSEIPPAKEIYLLETKDLTAFGENTKTDGETQQIGTNNYFTAIWSTKSKIDSSSKTFEDGYESGQRINFGASSTKEKNSLKFTTKHPANVKVWWVAGGVDRPMAIFNSTGNVAVSDSAVAKDGIYISEFNLTTAGEYYLGGTAGNDYIFKVEVVEILRVEENKPRKEWSEVAAPTITSATVGTGDDAGTITVKVNQTCGYDGADKAVVTMYEGETVIESKNGSREGNEQTIVFTPSKSGTYKFKVVAVRDGEIDKEGTNEKDVEFKYPLSKPSITAATSKGNGLVQVAFTKVKEATSYDIYVGGTVKKTVTVVSPDTSSYETTFDTGVAVGQTANITVKPIRGEETGPASDVKNVVITADAQATWYTATYGPSTDDKNNGATKNEDGTVTIKSLGGKGKIVPAENDGLTFYYTKVPAEKFVTISGKIKVDQWTLSNGQEGFGLMVADGVGSSGDAYWNNSLQAIATKIEYYHDGTAITTDTSASKISMKLGVGTILKTGVLASQTGSGTMPSGFTSVTKPLETSAASSGTGTYNIIGGYTKDPGHTIANNTEFIFSMESVIVDDEYGYVVTYKDASGNVVGTQTCIVGDNDFTKIDAANKYAGFFAARNAQITVSDINVSLADAPRTVELPDTPVVANYSIISSDVANSSSYNLTYRSDVDGTVIITDANNNLIANQAFTAGTVYNFPVTLSLGSNTYTVRSTPVVGYKPSKHEVLSSYAPHTQTFTVKYNAIDGDVIYVAPNGSARNAGTKASPLDIYSAVSYVQPGQKIIIKEGTYNLTSTVTIKRGVDGTAAKPIQMMADPEATSRPVFSFGGRCEGMVFGGNYWRISGFDVTNSADTKDGARLCGSNNVVADCNFYHNGNTGLQISAYLNSADGPDMWPSNNLVLNCTSYGNADKGDEDADGFAAKLTCGSGNVFDGCVAYYNADDGWDLFAKAATGSIGAVTIKNSVAFSNGYHEDGTNAGNGNGFKMGGSNLEGGHMLINSVAFNNKAKGFDSNSCPDIKISNSISFNNESYNVALYTNNAENTNFEATGVISYKNKYTDVAESFKFKGTQDSSKVYNATNYFWNCTETGTNNANGKVTDAWFVSLDTKYDYSTHTYSELPFTRNADGTIVLKDGLLKLTDVAKTAMGAQGGSDTGLGESEGNPETDASGEESSGLEIKPPAPVEPPVADSENDDNSDDDDDDDNGGSQSAAGTGATAGTGAGVATGTTTGTRPAAGTTTGATGATTGTTTTTGTNANNEQKPANTTDDKKDATADTSKTTTVVEDGKTYTVKTEDNVVIAESVDAKEVKIGFADVATENQKAVKDAWDVVREVIDEKVEELKELVGAVSGGQMANPEEAVTITVDTSTLKSVPGDVIEMIKGSNVTLVLDMGNGVTWTINGNNVTADSVKDINFNVRAGEKANKTISEKMIEKVAGKNKETIPVTLDYDGEFGFKATLGIDIGKKNVGRIANLFYLNATKNELEFMNAGMVDENGVANLEFTHASDYTIILDDKTLGVVSTTTQVSNNSSSWLSVMLIVILALAGVGGILGFVIWRRQRI